VGSPPVQFKFLLRDVAGVWSVLQDYSPVSGVPWIPTEAGNYGLQVWARSTGSNAAFEDWRGTETFTIKPSAVPVVSSLTASVSSPLTVTNSMTWTAIAAGGTAPLQYKFWRYRQGSGWTVTQDYSPSPTYTWWAIEVWERASGSVAAYDTWRSSGAFSVGP
jgi:hypothetical protein